MIDIIYLIKRNGAIYRNIQKMAMNTVYKIVIFYLYSHNSFLQEVVAYKFLA